MNELCLNLREWFCAQKLTKIESLLFHIQKNQQGVSGGLFVDDPQNCRYQYRRRTGRVDRFLSHHEGLSGNGQGKNLQLQRSHHDHPVFDEQFHGGTTDGLQHRPVSATR